MKFEIVIPGAVPPSGNEMRRKYRHWAAYRDLRESWRQWIYNAGLAQENTLNFLAGRDHKKAKVSIHVAHNRARLLDDDNLSDGLKPVYDSLRRCGFIVNDSMRWMTRVPPTQERVKDSAQVKTVITIEVAE